MYDTGRQSVWSKEVVGTSVSFYSAIQSLGDTMYDTGSQLVRGKVVVGTSVSFYSAIQSLGNTMYDTGSQLVRGKVVVGTSVSFTAPYKHWEIQCMILVVQVSMGQRGSGNMSQFLQCHTITRRYKSDEEKTTGMSVNFHQAIQPTTLFVLVSKTKRQRDWKKENQLSLGNTTCDIFCPSE